jgi:hypothetical protein
VRRGRRDPHTLFAGDALDFWRVETFVPDHELGLVAEMKVPGRAWLQFEVEANSGGSVIRQTAICDPAGLAGFFIGTCFIPCIAGFSAACSTRLQLLQDAGQVLPPWSVRSVSTESAHRVKTQVLKVTPTEARVRDRIRAIEYKSQFVGKPETSSVGECNAMTNR